MFKKSVVDSTGVRQNFRVEVGKPHMSFYLYLRLVVTQIWLQVNGIFTYIYIVNSHRLYFLKDVYYMNFCNVMMCLIFSKKLPLL